MAVILERTTDEWLGTWAVLVETLVDDQRGDDPPIALEFTLDDGQKIVAPVTAVFGDRVHVRDRESGDPMNINDQRAEQRDRLRVVSYQQDDEPTVAQAVVAFAVIGALGWALVYRLLRGRR